MPAPFQDVSLWIILDFYLIYVISFFILKFVLHNKRMMSMFLFFVSMYAIYYGVNWVAQRYGHEMLSLDFYRWFVTLLPIFIIIISAPDIRLTLESLWKETVRQTVLTMGSEHTKNEIIKAVQYLSNQQIGALVTIEKHNTLDQYAQRAIQMNSEISKEVLVNIFTPNTPLHDGAVIVRGDRILCAGAYFVLSSNETFEKTTGSRHRAALGISEISDSLTIVVSEETGHISIAISGVMTRMKDQDTLYEYLSLFMR